MEFKTEVYGLNKKIKKARKNGFISNQTNNFKLKIYSKLSNMNIHYYFILCIPIMHRHSLF